MQKQVEREEEARFYQLRQEIDAGVYLTTSEVLAMFDLPLGPPA